MLGSPASSIESSLDEFVPETKFEKFGGYIALFGGFLTQLVFGSLFCFGNLSPYIASYLTHNDYMASESTEFDLATVYDRYLSQTNIVLFIIMTCFCTSIIFGGKLELMFGPTRTYMLSTVMVTAGFGLTSLALKANSIPLIVVTYGLLFGCGVGIGYPVLAIVCMRWFPKKRGLVCGLISTVFGAAPFVFDLIQAKLVNPNNLEIDPNYGYALQKAVIDDIPFMFVYVAGIMFTMQCISILCVKSPSWFVIQPTDGTDGQASMSKQQLKYESYSLTLGQAMKFWVFWDLWINNFLYCVVLMFMTSEWKVFGMNYMHINNDSYLSLIGSIASLFNALGRFSWGIIYDKNKSFVISMGALCAICTLFIATLPFIKYVGDASAVNALFAVWLFAIWSCAGCEYAFLPSVLVETFGAKYVGPILGVFVGGEVPATAVVVLLSHFVFKNNDRDWMMYCFTMAGCTLISTVQSLLYRKDRLDRRKYLKAAAKGSYQAIAIECSSHSRNIN